MVQKRPFGDETYGVSSKHPRQLEYICQLSALEFVCAKDTAWKPKISGEGEGGFSNRDEKHVDGNITELPICTEKDSETSFPGCISNTSWASSSTSEEDDESQAQFQLSFSPEWYNSYQPRRTLGHPEKKCSSLLECPPRKLVSIGLDFQANLPEWGAKNARQALELDLSDHNDVENKLAGICVIPMPEFGQSANDSDKVGGGRTDCCCEDSGSVRCVRQHIKETRERLCKTIGHERFSELGFSDMGEVVAYKWSREEQQLFHDVVYSNPASWGKNFWDHLSIVFPTRAKKDIASYYFNVFMLQRRGRSVSNYRMVGVAGPAVSTGTAAATAAYGCFKPHFDYVYDLDNNYKELNKESDELSELKRDTEIHISQNESAMEMTNQCRNWLRNVRTAEGKIQDLKQRYKKASKCLCGMCPFLKLRKLSKSIFDTTKDVVKLKTKMNELKQNANVMTTRRPPPLATNIVELNSLTNNAQELLNLLGQKDLKRIGIFGMKGVGKTTLLEKLYAEAGQNCRFDIAILVSCQEEDSVRKLQEYLLRQLELTVNENDSTKKVGDRISEKLENMEYLLLLDQVFSCINLHEVGIRDCHKYGKAVFASREKIICKEMDANEYFQVKLLPLEDAVALFQTIVGDVVRTNKTIEGIAKKIAKESGGLPLAIKAMAIDLKHENYVCTWQNAVWTLQQAIDGPQQHLQEVFNIFELLYGQLHVNMRRCLLYAALFPGGYEIYKDYLVEGWKVQGLIRDVQGGNGQTFEDARIRGDYFLEHLTELSLLAKCLKEKYIKMPELVRNQAHHLYPKEEECQIVVDACTEEKEWRDAGRIALMHNRPLSLPKKPKCGKLSTLLLQRNDDLEIIPKSFFTHMKKLQILDLYHTSIKLLPPSLFSLIDLKALYLNDCPCLAVLSSKIAKLQNLEILDIRETGIRSLPIEIGKLKNLKCFRVSFPYNDAIADSPETNILHCWKHKKPRVMIPPNLIRKLHLLEELTIIVDPKDQSWKGIADYIAEEVASLKHLTIRRVPGQASPSVYGTPPEGSPSVNRHGIIRSQPLDYDKDIPLATLNHNHNNGEIQEASSSNSMTAAARPHPPSDPSL